MGWLIGKNKRRDDAERAFLEHVVVHWEGLFRYALRLANNDEQEAEDLVQETLIKALKAFDRTLARQRGEVNLRGWAFTILRNTFLSRVRRSGRELPLDEPSQVEDSGPAPPQILALVRPDDGYRHGFEDEVLAALDALPETQRSAIVLCDIEGMTYEEIATVLDCPVGTVRSRIHHARRRLRETLSGYANARGYDHVQSGR